MKKVVVLFSGGVESTALLVHYALRNYTVYPLYVRFGLPWEDYEKEVAKKVLNILRRRLGGILNLKVDIARAPLKRFKNFPSSEDELEIPLRNLILCTRGAIYAYKKGADRCAIGSLGIYPFPDNKREYFDKLEELISSGLGKSFFIETPFYGMEKDEVIKKYGRYIPLDITLSCINPVNGKPCGKCIKCREREEATKLL
ncbi:7-cyano-7-deazaguanine synthase [Aquifex sp.]